MAAARSSPRRAAMVVEEEQEEVHELQEGDFTVEVVQAAAPGVGGSGGRRGGPH